jgi:hypothetical protein
MVLGLLESGPNRSHNLVFGRKKAHISALQGGTIRMLSALLFTLLTASPGARQMLVVAGDIDKEAGARKLEEVKERMKSWPKWFSWSPGYPRLVESATVTGLKPGFFITVLSVCEPGQQDPALLPFAELLENGSYVREITSDETACAKRDPEVEQIDTPVANGPGWILRGLMMSKATHCHGEVVLRDKKGQLLDRVAVSFPTFCRTPSFQAQGKLLELSYTEENYNGDTGKTTDDRVTTRYSVKDGKISAK